MCVLFKCYIVIIILIRSMKLGESPGVPSARPRAPGVVCPGQRHSALCTTNYALVSAVSETHLRFKDLKCIIVIIIAIVTNIINIDIYIIITTHVLPWCKHIGAIHSIIAIEKTCSISKKIPQKKNSITRMHV